MEQGYVIFLFSFFYLEKNTEKKTRINTEFQKNKNNKNTS